MSPPLPSSPLASPHSPHNAAPPSPFTGGEAEGDAEAEVQPAEGGDGRDGEATEQARGADGSGMYPYRQDDGATDVPAQVQEIKYVLLCLYVC